MKQILILGDSYTYGHGCSDREYYYDSDKKEFVGDVPVYGTPASEYCWAALMQKDFPKLKVINLATQGRSMQGMFYDLYNYFLKVERSTSAQPEVDMIIFNGTMPDRIQISSPPYSKYNNTMSWGLSWAGDPAFPETEDRALAKELYKKWLYHEEIGEIMALSALYGAHSYAISRGIKFMWNMPKLALPPQLKETTCASLAGTEIPALWSYDFSNAGIVAYNRKYLCPDYHANNLGHSEYYKREILPRMSRYYTRGD